MTATVNYSKETTEKKERLVVALEMGFSKIKVVSSSGYGKPRKKDVVARNLALLTEEIQKAKLRFGLAKDAPVVLCYEAGRDGFWLQRWLSQQGHTCYVIDPGSVKVKGKRRNAKTDRLDGELLLENLIDYLNGKSRVWSVVRVPTLEQEDRRQLHRELEELKHERTNHGNRMKGLLVGVGLSIETISDEFPKWLAEQRLPENRGAVPADLQSRLLREHERWKLVDEQIRHQEKEQARRVAEPKAEDPDYPKIRKLMELKGIGITTATILVREFFGWRAFRNRRELGGLAGLTPTPFESGKTRRELGMSKSGNQRVRWVMVEVSWCWLHWQKKSGMTEWYGERFGKGSSNQRKRGIGALARKLLIALWRWLEFDEKPKGAAFVEWEKKVGKGKKQSAQEAA